MATAMPWASAVEKARAVVTALDAVEALGVVDDDGGGTWKLVEIFLEKMCGQPIPMWDRHAVTRKLLARPGSRAARIDAP